MSDRGRERDEQELMASRRQWFERELGDEWVAQGDGTYRFVGSEAPLARDDSHEERARPDAGDEALERERRFPRVPWRRH